MLSTRIHRWVEYSEFLPDDVELLPRFAKMFKLSTVLLESGISVDLVGPKGVGKSTFMAQLAEHFGKIPQCDGGNRDDNNGGSSDKGDSNRSSASKRERSVGDTCLVCKSTLTLTPHALVRSSLRDNAPGFLAPLSFSYVPRSVAWKRRPCLETRSPPAPLPALPSSERSVDPRPVGAVFACWWTTPLRAPTPIFRELSTTSAAETAGWSITKR